MPTHPVTGLTPIGSSNRIEKSFNKESPLRKLIKVFRGDNVVRQHYQGAAGVKTSPIGTAKAFFRNAYSFNSSAIPGYSAYSRFARYSDYAEMESYPILAMGLNIYSDEVTQKNENGKIIEITSENSQIEKSLTSLFGDILHLNGKRIFKLVRNLLKYGDYFALIDATERNGVVNLIHMPANEVEKEEGFDPENPSAVRFRWTTHQNIELPNAYVAHFRLDGNDLFYPYGQSILEPARRPWRQLVLLEDSMMVYRITRAPERRVFFLDIMGAPAEDVDEIVNKFNQSIKKNKVVNEQGQIDLRYAATLSAEEDYIIPVRGGDSATRIETLPGGQNVGDIEDIEFVKRNLFISLGIPKAFLTEDEAVGSKQTLTQEDIRFARTVARVQESIIAELVKIGMIHLYIQGFRGKDLTNFRIKMTNPSTVAELQKNELWRARMDLVHSAGDGVFDTTFIYKEFLHLSDEEISKIRKGQILDKIFQAKLVQLENTGGMMDQGMGGMDMGMGGMGGAPLGGMDMGGMDAGMGGMDMGGGTPELGMTPPEQGFGEAKDLTRTSDERFAKDRGVDEIPGIQDESESDPNDQAGIRRTYKRPLGARESVEKFNDILEFMNSHTIGTNMNNLIDRIILIEYGIPIRDVSASDVHISEKMISESWEKFSSDGQKIAGTKQMLQEALRSAAQEQKEEDDAADQIQEWGSAKIEEINKTIGEIYEDKE